MYTSGSPNANGKSPQNEASIVNDTTLQADLTFLSSLLSKEGKDDNADVDVVALLRQLETADGVAQGVESRIDGILGSLDALLDSLQPDSAEGQSVTGDAKEQDGAKGE
ncbi:hypothetical protein HETIRDRAFT_99035 [Heterobasidion irregulare TC 32-1]|uniref:Uncharacterized protein n=1 Tax=Heterobasidion irregulare (strain TC 32-1) TaxID=747525 RepID=W4KMF6_HETIT|nr:uncharacterized protein HETIRDRAFT_99035 [Heterobasidion irregulare TC 32-1]ETW86560.1 hypothetical protein HETIRDRAFT_99035 [Heterobasidion irregulare TC 32-1]